LSENAKGISSPHKKFLKQKTKKIHMKKIALFGSSILATLTFAMFLFYQSCTPDPCKDVTCLNGGTCTTGTCTCVAGYEGTDCSTEMRTKFIGTYNLGGNYSCNGASGTGPISGSATIATSSTAVTKMLLTIGLPQAITSTVTSSTALTIDNRQIVDQGVTYSYTGSGSINGINLTLNITETNGTTGEICTYTITGVKQ